MKPNLRLRFLQLSLFFISMLIFQVTRSQNFTPVTVTGFNHDVVAETGNSSLTTTTICVDGPSISNKVLYTTAFRDANGGGGGGIPNDGLIAVTGATYQLAPYGDNNALLIQRSQSGDLTLTTPAKFSVIRVLAFATEGTVALNAVLHFSDGSSTNALTNYSLNDWFFATTSLVLSGIGRVTRASPASGFDGYPTNPRMYYIEIPIACADMQKDLQSITFSNATTQGNNAPFPNALLFAVSGKSVSQTVTATIINASCTTSGSATLNITGNLNPYNVTWNTTPVQTGLTATNLDAGTYTATITNTANCTSTFPVTITGSGTLSLTSAPASNSICTGQSTAVTTTSPATAFTWSPTTGVSDPTIANPTLSPTSTTTYTVTGTLGTCTQTASFTVNVTPAITLSTRPDTIICGGGSIRPNITSNATTYSWSPATGVSDPSELNPTITPTATTTYTLTATNGPCSATSSFKVTIGAAAVANAGPDVNLTQFNPSKELTGSGSQGTYLWTPSAGLSDANILNPVANPAVTTTYTLKVTTPDGCTATDDVLVSVLTNCLKPMEAFTPNGDGFNDKWIVSFGACAKTIRAAVFNRYGSKVFESTNYQNDWDGRYKGKTLPDGTYYFVLKYYLTDGTAPEIKGNVTILR